MLSQTKEKTQPNSSTLEEALRLHAARYSVHRYGIYDLHEYANPTEDQVTEQFRACPESEIEMFCGGPMNVYALDFENHSGQTGWVYDEWRKMIETEWSTGLLPRCVTYQTRREGFRVAWRCEQAPAQFGEVLARDTIDGKIETLIECPKRMVVPGGPSSRYTYLGGRRFEDLKLLEPHEQEVLIRYALGFNTVPIEPAKEYDPSTAYSGEDRPGDYFNKNVAWDQILYPKQWLSKKRPNNQTWWQRPGTDSTHASAIVYDDRPDQLYVLSSSVPPLENGHAYEKFSVYAALYHDGDYSAAASCIYSEGFKTLAPFRTLKEEPTTITDVAIDEVVGTYDVPDDLSPDPASTATDDSQPPHGIIVSASTPLTTARKLLAHKWTKDDVPILRKTEGDWWLWIGTHYEIRSSQQIDADVWRWLDDAKALDKKGNQVSFDPNTRKVNEVTKALAALCLTDVPIPSHLGTQLFPDEVICFQNGLLDVDAYLQGKVRLMPHTPLWFSANCLPFAFDEDATCPVWEQFLSEAMDGDQERIETLQEWMGYNLIADTRQQKIMMLLGSGRNGKGTFIRAMIGILGDGNYCTPTFTMLAGRFDRSQFVGKLAAIFADAHLGRTTDSVAVLEFLKAVSGEDRVSIEKKHKDVNTAVKLSTRITISTNEMPRLPDASTAIGKRMIAVPFLNDYTGREDQSLDWRIAREYPGVILWALAGLKRLRQRGYFVQPAKGQTIRKDFDALSSPLHAFVEDYCEIGKDCFEAKEVFRGFLNRYLTQNGHQLMSEKTITVKLRAINGRIECDRRTVEGKRVMGYTYIKLTSTGKAQLLKSEYGTPYPQLPSFDTFDTFDTSS